MKTALRTALILFVLLSGCGGGGDLESAPPPKGTTGIEWRDLGMIAGVEGNYTPIAMDGGIVQIYGNFANGTDGAWWLREGSWSSVGAPQPVLANPIGPDHFIRTSAVARDGTGRYLAILHVGPCYGDGCVSGFTPAIATSLDGRRWTYQGRVSPFGQYQSSSNSLIWTGSEFMAWEDGTGKPLVMMRSTDGLTWSTNGKDMWPIPGDAPQFCSAARTPQGVHLICCDTWPAQHHRHLFSCTGEPPWNVLEMDTPTRIADKGTNLYYEPATNLIHAVSSSRHFVLLETQRACGESS